MAHVPASPGAAITLEQLIALNDEIGALIRAGVPLEQGLYELGRDMPGQLGQVAAMLAGKMERGESLAQALDEQAGQMPPVYRAVVAAGARSGRLPAALESVAASARRTSEARRMVIGGIIYPLMVLLTAWGLWVVFAVEIAPRWIPMFAEYDAPGRGLLEQFAYWGESAAYWGPIVPLLVVILAGAWWIGSNRALVIEPRAAGLFLGWLPWTGSILQAMSHAMFAELLALLVENSVPLHEAVVLAAEAAGDPTAIAAARDMGAAIERGELPPRWTVGKGLPPLLNWLIRTGQQRGALATALRVAAETYRARAVEQAEFARMCLPVVLTVAVGGTATLGFALIVFGPWISLLRTMTQS